MLALKRMRRRTGLFVAIFGVVLLLSALGVGLSGYLGAAATSGARAGVAALTGADGGFDVSIPLASGLSAQREQDSRVRETVRETVTADGHPVAVTVVRDIVTPNTVELDQLVGAPVRVALASIPGLSSAATVTSGRWPTEPGEAAMQTDAAAALGVSVGEQFTLPSGTRLTMTATWRVRDPSDPRWLGDPITLSGIDQDGTPGWVVIDPSVWAVSGVDPIARWTIRPDPARITVAELSALERSPDTVSNALQRADRTEDVQETGLLQLGMSPIQQNVQSAAAVSTAPLVVLALLGVITMIELARMLEQLRSGENAVRRARGASRVRFVLEAAGEGAAVAAPAAAIGGAGAVWLLAESVGAGDIQPTGWLASIASAIMTVVALAAVAGRSSRDVRSAAAQRRWADSARGGAARAVRLRSTVGVGAVALLVLLAVVAVSQFLLYGSPLAPIAGGGVAVDPLAVSAPALMIAALGLLGVAAFPLVARGLERWSRRAQDLDSLPLRQLARRSRSALTPILVMAFAVSGLLIGATYSGTWQVSASQTRTVQIGTDVRATSFAPLGDTITRPVAGQVAAAPVARDDVQLGDSLVSLVAIPASSLSSVVASVPGAVDPGVLARAVRSTIARAQLPVTATGVSLRLTAAPASIAPTSADLLLVDAAGAENVLPLTPDAAGGFASPLPEGRAPWTVHGIQLLLPEVTSGATVAVDLQATGAATADIVLGGSWVPSWPDAADPGISGLGTDQAGLRATIAGQGGYVLLQSVTDGAMRLPIVISRALAESSGLTVGSRASLILVTKGGGVPVTIAGVSPVIPGTDSGSGVLVDLGAIQDAADREGLLHLSANEWWVSTRTPAAAVRSLDRQAPSGTVTRTAAPTKAEQVLASARTVVWIAGIATALLAMLTVASGLLAELRGRRDEVDVLRAVGVSARAQSRGRVVEWTLLLSIGIVVGLVDGIATSALLMPGLARTAVPLAIDGLRTYLNIDEAGALIGLAALLVTVAVLLLVVARTVRRQTR